MHMLLRTLWLFLRRRWLGKARIDEVTELSMRVLPIDLDLLLHVNNGVYLSYMDFGRWDMIFKNGVYDLSRKHGWYSVVTGETIRFRKSLKLWDKFTIRTQILGYDEKCFYISQKFLRQDELMADALVKVRFLRVKGGTLPVEEVLSAFGKQLPNQAGELSQEWSRFDALYLAS